MRGKKALKAKMRQRDKKVKTQAIGTGGTLYQEVDYREKRSKKKFTSPA
jgi:hypothetical protein